MRIINYPIRGILLVLILLRSYTGFSQEQPSKEFVLKAVFLYNFTQFVTWPEGTLEEGAPFVIGVVGRDPFGNYLEETVKGETMQGHPIVVQRFATPEAVTRCQILYINLTDRTSIRQLSERAAREHTLTVGDALVVEKQGGIVRFVAENNRTKIRINLAAAQAASLTISSKLLGLAEIIKP